MGWLCAGLVRSVPKCFRIQHAARCWEEWLWKDAALRGRSKHSSISAVPLAPVPTVCFDFVVVSRYPSTWVKSKWSHQTGLCCWLPSLIVSVVLLCMPSSCPVAALFHLCVKNSSLVLGCSEINRALSAFFCVHQKRILRVLHPSNSASWEFCKQGVRLKADVPGTKSERASYITASKGADSAANQGLSRWYLTFFFLMYPRTCYTAKTLKNIFKVHRDGREKLVQGRACCRAAHHRPAEKCSRELCCCSESQHKKGFGLGDALKATHVHWASLLGYSGLMNLVSGWNREQGTLHTALCNRVTASADAQPEP